MATSGRINCLGSQEAYPSAPSPGTVAPTEAVALGRSYSLVAIVEGLIPINVETSYRD